MPSGAPEELPNSEVDAKPISATPKVGQSIAYNGTKYTTIKEGLAYILVPHGTPTSTDPKMSKEDSQKQSVFYNPIQQFNRDLSVLAIKAYGEDMVARKRAQTERAHKRNLAKLQRKQIGNKRAGNTSDNVEDASSAKRRKVGDTGNPRQPIETTCLPSDILHGTAETGLTPTIIEPRTSGALDLATASNSAIEAEVAEHTRNGKVEPKVSFKILDALSATGLRALRYAQEIPFATSVTANDMSEKATEAIATNIKHNKLEDKITPHTGNAIAFMYSFVEKMGFDVIDLDPYGTAAPFLDASLQAIHDGGLVCVTCTDSAIFASHGYLEKTFSQYGGLPLKGEACHEGGIRLVLHAIATSGARYGLSIEPLLSLSIDYYIRVFVRVRKSPNDVKMHAGKTMMVYNCDSGCGAWTPQFLARHQGKPNRKGETFYKHSFAQGPSIGQHCEHCGQKTHVAGPMYGGPLHNPTFIKRILDSLSEVDEDTYSTKDRIEGMLHTAFEEMSFGIKNPEFNYAEKPEEVLVPKMDPSLIDEHPFFFIPSSISRVIHCQAPPTAAVRGALRHAGFKTTMSHCKPGSIKTTANWSQIWHIMREWVQQKAPLKNELKEGTAGRIIMQKAKSVDELGHAKNEGKEIESQVPADEVNEGTGAQSEAVEIAAAPGVPDERVRKPKPAFHINFEVVFDEKLGKDHERGKYVRYQLPPRENWGPMSRAK